MQRMSTQRFWLLLFGAFMGLGACEPEPSEVVEGTDGGSSTSAGASGTRSEAESVGGSGGEAGSDAAGSSVGGTSDAGLGGVGEDAISGGGTVGGEGAVSADGGKVSLTAGTSGTPSTAGATSPAGGACTGEIGPQPSNSEDSPLWSFAAYWCDLRRLCCRESCFGTGALDDCEAETLANQSDSYASGKILVDREALEECTQTLRERVVSCRETMKATMNLLIDSGIPACIEAIQGTIPEGEPCEEDAECIHDSEPSFCHKERERDARPRCVRVPRGQAGDPCFRTETNLFGKGNGSAWGHDINNVPDVVTRCSSQDGVYCDESSRRCVALEGVGSSCAHSKECADGLYCDANDQCRPRPPTGASCDEDTECADGACLEGKCTGILLPKAFCEGQ